jgi:hypothetical protein
VVGGRSATGTVRGKCGLADAAVDRVRDERSAELVDGAVWLDERIAEPASCRVEGDP